MQELEHTSATLAALETSSATLKDAHDEYGGQRARIKQSHKLLTRVHRASILDRLAMWAGVTLFTLVALYIVLKRAAYFVPPALVPTLPAVGLPSLASLGFGTSPAPMPVDVGGPGDPLAGQSGAREPVPAYLKWKDWALDKLTARQQAADGSGSAEGLLSTKQTTPDDAIRDRRADTAAGHDSFESSRQEWPDPSDPAYEAPPVQYSSMDSPASADSRPASGAHPHYSGGFNAMSAGVMLSNLGGGNTSVADSADLTSALPFNATALPLTVKTEMPQEGNGTVSEENSGNIAQEVADSESTDEDSTPEQLPATDETEADIALEKHPAVNATNDDSIAEVLEQTLPATEPALEEPEEAELQAEQPVVGKNVTADTEEEDISSNSPAPEEDEPVSAEKEERLDGRELPFMNATEEAEVAHRHAAPRVAQLEAGDTADAASAVSDAGEQKATAPSETPPPDEEQDPAQETKHQKLEEGMGTGAAHDEMEDAQTAGIKEDVSAALSDPEEQEFSSDMQLITSALNVTGDNLENARESPVSEIEASLEEEDTETTGGALPAEEGGEEARKATKRPAAGVLESRDGLDSDRLKNLLGTGVGSAGSVHVPSAFAPAKAVDLEEVAAAQDANGEMHVVDDGEPLGSSDRDRSPMAARENEEAAFAVASTADLGPRDEL